MKDLTEQVLLQALKKSGFNLAGAARLLGVARHVVQRKVDNSSALLRACADFREGRLDELEDVVHAGALQNPLLAFNVLKTRRYMPAAAPVPAVNVFQNCAVRWSTPAELAASSGQHTTEVEVEAVDNCTVSQANAGQDGPRAVAVDAPPASVPAPAVGPMLTAAQRAALDMTRGAVKRDAFSSARALVEEDAPNGRGDVVRVAHSASRAGRARVARGRSVRDDNACIASGRSKKILKLGGGTSNPPPRALYVHPHTDFTQNIDTIQEYSNAER